MIKELFLQEKMREYCNKCNLSYHEVTSPCKKKKHIAIRQIFYFHMHKTAKYRLIDLAKAAGRTNHTTVLNALKVYRNLKKTQDALIKELEEKIRKS